MITHPDIGTYLLVAGDGDYSPLVQRLREFGKHVVDSAFDERNYGCRSFKEFLGRMSDVVVIEGGDESGHLRVRLREPVPEPRVEA